MAPLPSYSITNNDVAALANSQGLILDDEDRVNILTSQTSIDVQACPGSGKTTLIAAKLMLLAQSWSSDHQGICVLSHTNVAKDEILDRLARSKIVEVHRLLGYPHFIGTIQEFVNRFLALPYLRSRGITDFKIDNDEYVKAAQKLLRRGEFAWLRGTLNGLGDDEKQASFLRSTFRTNATDINIVSRPQAWRMSRPNLERANADLSRLKSYLEGRGLFLYRDMYTYADLALSQNNSAAASLRQRFPLLLVDEMQDTQKFQDELLQTVFHQGSTDVAIQRFGDPDQAIFHAFGVEEPNESYNGKSRDQMDYVVHRSHRFDERLATKIKALSLNEIPLETELSEPALEKRAAAHFDGGAFEHSIILFNDETRKHVIEKFAQLTSEQFDNGFLGSQKAVVKVVGAVGKEVDADDQLRVGHYWEHYSKQNSATGMGSKTLMQIARHCRELQEQDWAPSYRLLLDGILKLMRMAGVRDEAGRHYSTAQLREALSKDDRWRQLRELIFELLCDAIPLDEEVWALSCTLIKDVCGIGAETEEIDRYLAYDAEQVQVPNPIDDGDNPEPVLTPLKQNRIRHRDGFEIQLSTIHGVKGETHDATLILETKNYTLDLKAMLPYLEGALPSAQQSNENLPSKPHATRRFQPNKVFMRQLYVAASRPKHFLCLAMHENGITDDQRRVLEENQGWHFETAEKTP